MTPALAIATMAFVAAAAPTSTTVHSPLSRPAAQVHIVEAVGQGVPSVWDGRWQGATVSGQPLVLDVRVKDQRMTGKLTVGKKSAKIKAGKALDLAFAITTDKIDGSPVSATGRQVGDGIELTIEGVAEPLMLTRAR